MSNGILNGNAAGIYVISASLTPSSVATITAAEQTFTVTGLLTGDIVHVSPPSITAGVTLATARVSAANTLALTFVNPTAGSLTPAAGTHVISVVRPAGNVAKTSIID
jgi:hypothetical protein